MAAGRGALLICMVVCMTVFIQGGILLETRWQRAGREGKACMQEGFHSLHGSQDLNRNPNVTASGTCRETAMLDQSNRHSSCLVPYIGYLLYILLVISSSEVCGWSTVTQSVDCLPSMHEALELHP